MLSQFCRASSSVALQEERLLVRSWVLSSWVCLARILYRNYAHAKFDVEREAFAMQGNPKAFPLIIAALKERCR